MITPVRLHVSTDSFAFVSPTYGDLRITTTSELECVDNARLVLARNVDINSTSFQDWMASGTPEDLTLNYYRAGVLVAKRALTGCRPCSLVESALSLHDASSAVREALTVICSKVGPRERVEVPEVKKA